MGEYFLGVHILFYGHEKRWLGLYDLSLVLFCIIHLTYTWNIISRPNRSPYIWEVMDP